MPKLDVYVSDECWSCRETRRLVACMREHFPYIDIAVFDLDRDNWPQHVFAVPTYILDGKLISLGNPTEETLQATLQASQNGANEQTRHARTYICQQD